MPLNNITLAVSEDAEELEFIQSLRDEDAPADYNPADYDDLFEVVPCGLCGADNWLHCPC